LNFRVDFCSAGGKEKRSLLEAQRKQLRGVGAVAEESIVGERKA
jgi:hypothetical protein